VSFYSGANLPSQHGEPPMLASGNVRYLLPAFAAACAMVAPALGALIPAAILAPLLGVASVAQMAPLWSRIGIALTVAAILYAAGASRFATRLAPRVVASVLIAVVLILAPSHAKIEARIWDGYASRLTLLPSSLADSLRREAHGRTIATTGLDGSWQVVGSRLEGRPAYVPIQRSWTQARSMWDFTPDDRMHGDRERWLANLRAADAAFVAIGWSDTSAAPVESLWCASDSTRFTARSLQPHRLVFAVR